MIDSTGGLVNLAQSLQQTKLQDQHAMLMAKKVNEQTQQEGQQIMQMIQAVPQPGSANSGHSIDLFA